VESPAWGVNQLCGSGLRTVALGYQALLNGDSEIVVAGGQESMSMAPHAQYLPWRRQDGRGRTHRHHDQGRIVGPPSTATTLGNTAEKRREGNTRSTRAQQDEFAVSSQNKAEAAQKAGKFKDEIVPVTIKSRKGDIVVDTDEYPRHGATLDAMAKLKPAFEKDGTVTRRKRLRHQRRRGRGGVLMTAKQAAKEGKTVLARIVSWGQAGGRSEDHGKQGPIPASRAALKKAGWKIGDLDLIEANEAFAAQACAVNKDHRLGYLQGQRQRRLRSRSVIPFGASGARVLVTLLARNARSAMRKKGLATCASAAAWASPCASHATNCAAVRDEKIVSQLRHTLLKKCSVAHDCARAEHFSSGDVVKRPGQFRLIKDDRGGFDMARVALVTGGTRGIGLRSARRLRQPAIRSPPITAATTRRRRNSKWRPAFPSTNGT